MHEGYLFITSSPWWSWLFFLLTALALLKVLCGYWGRSVDPIEGVDEDGKLSALKASIGFLLLLALLIYFAPTLAVRMWWVLALIVVFNAVFVREALVQ